MASSAREIQEAIEAEIHKDSAVLDEIREGVRKVASDGAEFGKQIAPVGGDHDPHPGAFRDSIQARDRRNYGGLPAAQIVSDNPAASFIEYGTERTPEHATFAQIAQHFGFQQTHAHFDAEG